MVAESHNTPSITSDERISRLAAFDFGLNWLLYPAAVVAIVLAAWAAVGLGEADLTGAAIRLYAPAALLLAGFAMATVRLSEKGELLAWRIIGLGVALLGFSSLARSAEDMDWFSTPDLNLVALMAILGFVAMGVGAIQIPRLDGIIHTRFRAAVDGVSAGVAISVLAWEVLRKGLEFAGSVEFLIEVALVGAMGTVVVAFVFVLMRQEQYRSDLGFRLTGIAVVLLVGAVVVWRALADPGFGSTEIQTLELLAGAALLVAVIRIRGYRVKRDSPSVRTPVWKLVVWSSLVIGMMGVTFFKIIAGDDDLGLLPIGLMVVTAASGLRQVSAARENRELVAKERDQLIAAVSHELATPLTAVAGFSEVLSDNWASLDEDERDEMVGIIQHQSRYLTGMVTDMVSLVRDQLHTVELSVERLDGKQLIADAVRTVFDLNVGPLPVKAQVEPYLEVVGDKMRLHQVLVSMLKNAQRYGGGKILIIARREVDWRIIEIHDNGPGISTKHEAAVWKRFERGEHELNETLPGSGLGLSMVRSLVAAHGGATSYRQSEKLGGACFALRLPTDRNASHTADWLEDSNH